MFKKTLLVLMFFATTLQAAVSTEAIQTPDRQTVAIGDRLEDMRTRMQASPIKMESHPLQIKGQPTTLAVDYTYEIANMRYVITIVNDHVHEIKTENLDGLRQ
ncbi:hypothetical protein F7P75_00605 [Acinetobacter gandensis]|uniref:DUF2845 domain-containing protein n=1 Tax=Acinetobacter gandensis TaxID=1443941 RepID=A0A1A7RCP2_9GAMM|nr:MULTISPECIES: hypothetical protein [Acinetobacter]KAB0630227.1 hypothetical protein F7P75_00605 [Acinetobacter gandensis]OBX28472.1 hypothetical protein A9J31_05205 [Acinetobacter gandensis]